MNKGGRPTKYKPEYCDLVIEKMNQGFSKEAMAGHIGISKSTLYEWTKKHKEFSNAIKEGVELSRVFWEDIGITGVLAGQGNATMWAFNMKNRFGWADKKEIEHKGSEESPIAIKLDVK